MALIDLHISFRGYVETTLDALLKLEAARRGVIPRVTRRMSEYERKSVQSGLVFVFDEKESGIKRWTDDLLWTPSSAWGKSTICPHVHSEVPATV